MPDDKPQGSQDRIEVLAAVDDNARDMAEQGRFPDGSYCRMCRDCGIGSPAQGWENGKCPECGSAE